MTDTDTDRLIRLARDGDVAAASALARRADRTQDDAIWDVLHGLRDAHTKRLREESARWLEIVPKKPKEERWKENAWSPLQFENAQDRHSAKLSREDIGRVALQRDTNQVFVVRDDPFGWVEVISEPTGSADNSNESNHQRCECDESNVLMIRSAAPGPCSTCGRVVTWYDHAPSRERHMESARRVLREEIAAGNYRYVGGASFNSLIANATGMDWRGAWEVTALLLLESGDRFSVARGQRIFQRLSEVPTWGVGLLDTARRKQDG